MLNHLKIMQTASSAAANNMYSLGLDVFIIFLIALGLFIFTAYKIVKSGKKGSDLDTERYHLREIHKYLKIIALISLAGVFMAIAAIVSYLYVFVLR